MKNNENNITGYIEGYYGRLLSWKSRKLIIKSLHKNKMNTYFYAPKEDVCHRMNWKKKYGKKWRLDFRDFIKFSKNHDFWTKIRFSSKWPILSGKPIYGRKMLF